MLVGDPVHGATQRLYTVGHKTLELEDGSPRRAIQPFCAILQVQQNFIGEEKFLKLKSFSLSTFQMH